MLWRELLRSGTGGHLRKGRGPETFCQERGFGCADLAERRPYLVVTVEVASEGRRLLREPSDELGEHIRPRGPESRRSRALGTPEADPSQATGELSLCLNPVESHIRSVAKELKQGGPQGSVMLARKVLTERRWGCSEKVIGSRDRTEIKKEPSTLQVG